MTRLHSLGLVVLLASASAVDAVNWPTMPSWDTVSGYFTQEAATNGWNNACDFTKEKSQALYDEIKAHPYIAAGIAAGAITVAGLLYKVKQKYDAHKKRQQEEDDLVFAMLLEQVLQDEEYARQLQEQYNNDGMEPSAPSHSDLIIIDQMLSDEDFARQLQEQLNSFFVQYPVAQNNIQNDAAFAELLLREEEDAMHARNAQIEQDADFAFALNVQEVY